MSVSNNTVFSTRQVDCTTAVDNSPLQSKLGVVLGDQWYKRSQDRKRVELMLVMSFQVTPPTIIFQTATLLWSARSRSQS
jgi:hypothetical protein